MLSERDLGKWLVNLVVVDRLNFYSDGIMFILCCLKNFGLSCLQHCSAGMESLVTISCRLTSAQNAFFVHQMVLHGATTILPKLLSHVLICPVNCELLGLFLACKFQSFISYSTLTFFAAIKTLVCHNNCEVNSKLASVEKFEVVKACAVGLTLPPPHSSVATFILLGYSYIRDHFFSTISIPTGSSHLAVT